jgi:hypothetical protein
MVAIMVMIMAIIMPAILTPVIATITVMPVAVAASWEEAARQGERDGKSQQSYSKFHGSSP